VLATDAEGAEVGAASAKRARHGSETEVRLPPAYAHPVAHPAPAPSRTNMCCRAYHYAFAFAAVAAVAALAAVALAADAPPRAVRYQLVAVAGPKSNYFPGEGYTATDAARQLGYQ